MASRRCNSLEWEVFCCISQVCTAATPSCSCSDRRPTADTVLARAAAPHPYIAVTLELLRIGKAALYCLLSPFIDRLPFLCQSVGVVLLSIIFPDMSGDFFYRLRVAGILHKQWACAVDDGLGPILTRPFPVGHTIG